MMDLTVEPMDVSDETDNWSNKGDEIEDEKRVCKEKNITMILGGAFYGCKKLQIVKMGKNVKTIGDKAFKGIKSNATIKVPKKKYNAYKTMFKKKGVSKKARYKKI